MSASPKRRARSARGRDRSAPTVERPSRKRSSTHSASRRSAATGSAERKRRAPPFGTMVVRAPPRAAAQAAPKLSAMAALQGKPARLDRRHDIGQERVLASPKMSTARDVEQKSVGRIGRCSGAEAAAPIGKCRERFQIVRGCCGMRHEIRQKCPRIGELLPDPQTQRTRRRIERRDKANALDLSHRDQRLIRPREWGLAAPQPRDRPIRQPHAHDPAMHRPTP